MDLRDKEGDKRNKERDLFEEWKQILNPAVRELMKRKKKEKRGTGKDEEKKKKRRKTRQRHRQERKPEE